MSGQEGGVPDQEGRVQGQEGGVAGQEVRGTALVFDMNVINNVISIGQIIK